MAHSTSPHEALPPSFLDSRTSHQKDLEREDFRAPELERQMLTGSQGPSISRSAAFFPILVEKNKSPNKGTLSALASGEGRPGNGDPSIYAASKGQTGQAAPDPLPDVMGLRDPLLERAISHLVLAYH